MEHKKKLWEGGALGSIREDDDFSTVFPAEKSAAPRIMAGTPPPQVSHRGVELLDDRERAKMELITHDLMYLLLFFGKLL